MIMERPDVPPFTWYGPKLNLFWQFIAERHMVFRRRILNHQPPPWTDDPVLQSVYFTNVYRELDRGTRYVINHLLDWREPVLSMFNVIAYRSFNQIKTHQALVNSQNWNLQVIAKTGDRHIVQWSLPWARRTLQKLKESGVHVFTGAFLITGTGDWSGKGGKIGLVCENLTRIWKRREMLYRDLIAQKSMEEAHRFLTTLPGIGPFMAYELVIDLCYRVESLSLLQFTEDDWVNMGPGCRRGLRHLTGRSLSAKEGQAAIYDLWVAQDRMLYRANAILRGPKLSLRNIEHCLCEYQKYVRALDQGPKKRGYRVDRANADLTPWDDLPGSYR